jgi:ATP-dependent protease ClpP protease subunit
MYGHAMSMGSIIPQAADERLIDKRCRFMIHYGYDGGHGHSKLFEKWSDEGKVVNYEMENIYLDKMLEKDEAMRQAGTENYLEGVMSALMDRQNAFQHPPAPKTKYKFSKVPAKRREDVRIALRDFLNFDSFLTAEETVSLGLADGLIEE